MKNQSLKKTDEKYLEVLFRIKHECEMGGEFSLSELIRGYSVGNAMGVVIQDAGIVTNIGHKNRPRYIWKSIRPNIKMAERVRQEMTKRVMSYQKTKVNTGANANLSKVEKANAKIHPVKTRKEKDGRTKNISILWGMIKLEIK